MKKFKVRSLRKILLTVLFITILYTVYPLLLPRFSVFAQCQNNDRNQGLISATQGITGKFGNLDKVCITGNDASYREFKVPTYQDLEDQFYTFNRSSTPKSSTIPPSLAFTVNGIYLHNGNLTISNSPVGLGAQVIFVKGDLNIAGDIDYAETDPNSGLVFIVKGNINIYSTVRKVNAVLISFGQICTAYLDTSCADGINDITLDLTIYGSLISLNPNPPSGNAIQFKRNLTDNLQPAEIINQQAKYLYILRNGLFSKDLIIITEDRHYPIP